MYLLAHPLSEQIASFSSAVPLFAAICGSSVVAGQQGVRVCPKTSGTAFFVRREPDTRLAHRCMVARPDSYGHVGR